MRHLLALSFIALLGCEKGAPPPTEKCTKVAEQCKLPSGPLGVCNLVDCKPGDEPPCFRCVSQH